MPKFLGIAAAFLVFVGWMRIVGNPHVVETVIGLVIAAVVGVWVYRSARRFTRPGK